MPSPFPGMDPYLEAQGFWPDLHVRLIASSSELLNRTLPRAYITQIDQRIRLLGRPESPDREYRPDVAVVRRHRAGPGAARPAEEGAVATLEPVPVTLDTDAPPEEREARIQILLLPGRELVTVIEVLSPSNKAGQGRDDYKAKRSVLIHQGINLVEIDLLLAGDRTATRDPLPPGDYCAIVSRAERRPQAEAYGWSIRRPLPAIPVPLRPPDPDVPLDLAELFNRAYDTGRYDDLVDYAAPLGLPLSPDDRAWAERLAAGARRA